MTTYQIETVEQVWDDVLPLLQLHYDEIAGDKDVIPLDPDLDRYKQLQANNNLLIVTARTSDNKLIGYNCMIITTHLHYKSTKFAIDDVYFVDKEYRGSAIGIRMFKFVEQELKKLGVVKSIYNTKVHQDHTKLFEHLGYTLSERMFTKILK